MPTTKPDSSQITYGAGTVKSALDALSGGGATTGTVFDYLTTPQIADVQARTYLLDLYTPLQTALNDAIASGEQLLFPPGGYLTSATLDAGTVGANESLTIRGSGQGLTVIRKSAATATPVLKIGSAAATAFSQNVLIADIAIEGDSVSTTTSGIECYDLVRSEFDNVKVSRCGTGIQSYGGIGNVYNDVETTDNVRGMQWQKFTSLAGGGWPNAIVLNQCRPINNTSWGIDFDHGRGLTLNGGDVEGNGTNGIAATGGLRIGPLVGTEGGGSPLTNILAASAVWFESNAGGTSVLLSNGVNVLEGCRFTNSPNATYDIDAVAGNYHVLRGTHEVAKAANIREGASVSVGNSIVDTYVTNISYNAAKTRVQSGTVNLYKSGNLVRSIDHADCLIQDGYDFTAAGVVNVVFANAFSGVVNPSITVTIASNDVNTLVSPEIYNISTTGFTVRKKSITSGSATVGTVVYPFSWIAVGTKA